MSLGRGEKKIKVVLGRQQAHSFGWTAAFELAEMWVAWGTCTEVIYQGETSLSDSTGQEIPKSSTSSLFSWRNIFVWVLLRYNPSFLSIAVIKHSNQRQLGKEKVYFILQSLAYPEEKPRQKLEAGGETEAEIMEELLLIGLLFMACSPCLSSSGTSAGLVLCIVGWDCFICS